MFVPSDWGNIYTGERHDPVDFSTATSIRLPPKPFFFLSEQNYVDKISCNLIASDKNCIIG